MTRTTKGDSEKWEITEDTRRFNDLNENIVDYLNRYSQHQQALGRSPTTIHTEADLEDFSDRIWSLDYRRIGAALYPVWLSRVS